MARHVRAGIGACAGLPPGAAGRQPALTRDRRWAEGAGAAALLLLCLGLVPVWGLALQTPFRLIDDYGAVFPVHRLGVARFLRDNFSLAVNPVRFRPTHDLGQVLCYGLFSTHAGLHHLVRLLMKLAAFAALSAVSLRAIEGVARRRLPPGERLPLLALAVALFLYFPNNPEARLAPQELGTVMYFMGALFFLGRRPAAGRPAVAGFVGFACFALALWCKEPNFIAGAPLLVVAAADHAQRGGSLWKRTSWVAAYFAVWAHAALKASVMNRAGYGRSPLRWTSVEAMVRELPGRILLSTSAGWVPLVFITGMAAFVVLRLRHPPEGRLRAGLPLWMLLASLAAWLLMWKPVLRYAAPAAAFLALVTVTGFGLLLARTRSAGLRAGSGCALAVLAVLVAAASYRDLAAQFAAQYVAGRTEEAVLAAVERAMAQGPSRPMHVAPASEYEYRLGVYFNEHRPFFAGRSTPIVVLRKPADVPAGGCLVARQAADGFEPLLRVDPSPPPRILAHAEAISRLARPGAAPAPPVLDAGVEPPLPWFVLRKRE